MAFAIWAFFLAKFALMLTAAILLFIAGRARLRQGRGRVLAIAMFVAAAAVLLVAQPIMTARMILIGPTVIETSGQQLD
jgi:NADH:ubiquinone oxidoreductase subunit K